jgi:hypothetical protein
MRERKCFKGSECCPIVTDDPSCSPYPSRSRLTAATTSRQSNRQRSMLMDSDERPAQCVRLKPAGHLQWRQEPNPDPARTQLRNTHTGFKIGEEFSFPFGRCGFMSRRRQRDRLVEAAEPAANSHRRARRRRSGSRNRFIVNSIFCDCISRQLSASVWYGPSGSAEGIPQPASRRLCAPL